VRTHIKVVVTKKDTHIHCSIYEAEQTYEGGTFTYAKNGDLIFSREAFWGFYDSLDRGRSNAVTVHLEDRS